MTDPARTQWNPDQYARFEAERDRAALDLMLRLPDDLDPHEIWDLGCGPGHHAALLRRRHRGAAVYGLDSSPAMLERARALDAGVDWVQGDIADWVPDRPVDLIFANASLQWTRDHEALFPRLVQALAPGGVLAVQMPLGHATRHHALLRETAGQGPWTEALAGVERTPLLLDPARYYELTAGACETVDVWSATYLHALTGEDAVLEWVRGTALRPYLTALADDPTLSAAFEDALGDALSQAFPMRADGVTLLPFPRLFLVARRR
ncbi:MAG: methyltransferase domain-containing protein [Caulobacterales bacterium]|nr:methyltransferase domain-containing protein [Caulobacterales bacterium]